jgi:hypothetical protein
VTGDVRHFEPTGVRIQNPFTPPDPARNRQDRRAGVRN